MAMLPNLFQLTEPKKTIEVTEEPPPVHSKSNIKLNTSISLSSIYITCKKSTAKLKLISNQIVLCDTSTLSIGTLC
jgi:hypothetical protein